MIQLSQENSSPIIETLASAFLDDPLYTYLFPDTQTRKMKLKVWFEFARRYCLNNGVIFTSSIQYEGVAMWMKSENSQNSLNEYEKSANRDLKESWGKEKFEFYANTGSYIKPFLQQIDEPYWYLFIIGVHSSHQNKGIGTSLINEMFKLTNSDKRPYVLETITEKSMHFYEKCGFNILGEVYIPKANINNWVMIKPTI